MSLGTFSALITFKNFTNEQKKENFLQNSVPKIKFLQVWSWIRTFLKKKTIEKEIEHPAIKPVYFLKKQEKLTDTS